MPAEIETPGRNQKRYLAGALTTDTGYFLFVAGRTMRSELFVALLKRISASYRRARMIHLLVDNYSIHASRATRKALAALRDRIVLHFLPPYSPEYNSVELVWRQLHADVTTNHRFRSMRQLMNAVITHLEAKGRIRLQGPLPLAVTQHGFVVSDEKEAV